MSTAIEIGTTGFTPGWHEDKSMDDYLADPAVSASRLWMLSSRTPDHLRAELEAEAEARKTAKPGDPKPGETEATELGTVLHAKLYDPKAFERYVVIGRCEGKKRDGERCTYQGSVYRDGQSFCGTHDPAKGDPLAPGVVTVPATTLEDVKAMDASLRAHRTAWGLLDAPGPSEVVGVFQDRETGLWIRIRPDHLILDPAGAPDVFHWSDVNLKSTGKIAAGEPFRRDFEKLGHHFRAALYRMGLRELWDVEPQNFFYPTVESYPPYAVVVHRLHEDWMDDAEREVRYALRTLADCIEKDRWPAYGLEVRDLNLPEWRLRQVQMLDSVEFEEVA